MRQLLALLVAAATALPWQAQPQPSIAPTRPAPFPQRNGQAIEFAWHDDLETDAPEIRLTRMRLVSVTCCGTSPQQGHVTAVVTGPCPAISVNGAEWRGAATCLWFPALLVGG